MPIPLPTATAALLYGIWTALTWWFEGRIGTLMRPDAIADRVTYALVVNLAVGVVAPILVLRFVARKPDVVSAAGLGSRTPRLIMVVIGLVLGLAGYVGFGGPSSNLTVFFNAYAQVLVVSAAEIMVCYALPAAALASWKAESDWRHKIGLVAVSAMLFGIYHFAHSPPFNEIGMVLFLSVVGVGTGALFVLSRDVYATILFHNFLGTLGVTQALSASGQLGGFGSPQWPLLGMAAATLVTAFTLDVVLLRRFRPAPTA